MMNDRICSAQGCYITRSRREYVHVKYLSGVEVLGWKIKCDINNCKRCERSSMVIHPAIQFINNKYEFVQKWHCKLHVKNKRATATEVDVNYLNNLITMIEIMDS